jgi:AcrR family transcriptional regulator
MLALSTQVLPQASQEILLRPDFQDRLHIVTDSAVGLLRAHGAAGLTIRRIATDCEMSIGWLTNRFENKDRMISLITMTVGERWLQWITSRVDEMGTLALLPDSDDEIPAVNVWLTLLDLGRIHEGVGAQTAAVRAQERAWAATLLRTGPTHYPSPDDINATIALVDGLRVALCAPVDQSNGEGRVSVADARRLLLPQQGVVRGRAGVA